MRKDELIDEYFNWMCQLVLNRRYTKNLSYSRLLRFLDNIDFTYTIEMDGNREADGIDLRYRFGHENSYEHSIIAAYLDVRPCSVLEMMIALAIRCEEQIMDDPDIGNRTGQWFWDMIDNLGLYFMTNSKFDEEFAYKIINKFLNRRYKRNGDGGLFKVKNCNRDLRTVEIWYQMCWYLNQFV